MELTKEQIKQGLDKAYKEAGHNAYFGNGFEAGVKFALEQFKILNTPVVINCVDLEPDFIEALNQLIDTQRKPTKKRF